MVLPLLKGGGSYEGLVDRSMLPNGLGKEYYPALLKNQTNLRYYGYFLNGKKHGNGTLYNTDGTIKYEGEFVNNKPKGS